MRESSLIPTNLLSWPRVEQRLPEEKLILMAVWAAPWLKSIGVGEVPLSSFASSLGIGREATETGIKNMESAGLIFWDRETNELAIVDWFRFHKFKGVGIGIAQREIEKIRSESIKKLILEKSKTCLLTPTPTLTLTLKTTTPTPTPAREEEEGLKKMNCNKATPNPSASETDKDIEDYVEAALAEKRRAGKRIDALPSWKKGVRQRIKQTGFDQDDLALLASFRAQQVKETAKAKAQEVEANKKAEDGRAAGVALETGKALFDGMEEAAQKEARQQYFNSCGGGVAARKVAEMRGDKGFYAWLAAA